MQHKNFLTKTRWLVTIILLTTLCIGQMWGAGTESFENLSSATSYDSRSWTGTNGQTGWAATNARTDLKTAGSRGLTFKASTASTITMKLTSAQQSAGFGVLTFKYKYPYSDSGKSRELSITIGKNTYSSGTLSYTSSVTTGTITVNQSLASATVTINVNNGGGRICVDEFSWTSYSAGTSVTASGAASSNGTFTLSGSPATTTSSAGTVTVNCTPNTGYYVSAVSATNPATAPSGSISYGGSGNTRTVTYPTGWNGNSTITVTFTPIWYLKGSFNSWSEDNSCTVADGIATATVSLAKNTKYEFQFYDKQNNTWYYNGGNIVEDISGWTFTGGSGANCKIFTGKAGTYTFKINTSTKAVQVIYPTPSHPDDAYVYFKKWADWNDNYFAHWWDGGGTSVQDYNSAIRVTKTYSTCDNDYIYFPILADYPNFLLKDAASGDGSHKTPDLSSTSNGAKYYDFESWKNFNTYTITYAGNGNTGGSMTNVSGICPGNNVTLASNGYTKTDHTFSGWTANVDVKIGGATVTAGTLIANTATIQDIQGNITLTAQWVHVPVITVSKTSIAFGDKKVGGSYQETFTVSGSYLTANIGLAISGANPTLFSVDKTTLTPSAGSVATTTITVTWTPSASYNAATITISSTGATSKTVNLSGTGKWEVVWKNNGVTHATTLVASGTKPTFPSTPTSCDGTSTDFVGWTTAEWPGKINSVAGKTIHTNNTTMPNVSANGTIYYAVFAKADFEEGPAVGTTIYAEDFSGFSGNTNPSGTYTNSHTGTTLYGGGSVTYSKTDGSGTTQTKSESLAGGTSPELLVAKYSGTFVITGIPRCGASELTLSYKQNGNSLTSSVSGTDYSGGKGTSTSGTTSTDIICGSGSTFTLTFTGPSGNSNVRMDNILITVKAKASSYTQYLTNCCTSYDITLASSGTVSGGTFSASVPSACAGNEVTLSNSICSGYTVGAWTITKTSNGDDVTASVLEGNTLTMPAYGVTVALSTTAKVDHFIDDLHNTAGYTGTGATVTGCNQTVPNLSDKSAPSDESCEQLHYKFVGWVDEDHIDSDGTLLSGYSIVSGGTTSWNATGTNYYAVWAKEE